jgi:hypothetical protein
MQGSTPTGEETTKEDAAERVMAYIDGFNLYYGMKAAYGRKYL